MCTQSRGTFSQKSREIPGSCVNWNFQREKKIARVIFVDHETERRVDTFPTQKNSCCIEAGVCETLYKGAGLKSLSVIIKVTAVHTDSNNSDKQKHIRRRTWLMSTKVMAPCTRQNTTATLWLYYFNAFYGALWAWLCVNKPWSFTDVWSFIFHAHKKVWRQLTSYRKERGKKRWTFTPSEES